MGSCCVNSWMHIWDLVLTKHVARGKRGRNSVPDSCCVRSVVASCKFCYSNCTLCCLASLDSVIHHATRRWRKLPSEPCPGSQLRTHVGTITSTGAAHVSVRPFLMRRNLLFSCAYPNRNQTCENLVDETAAAPTAACRQAAATAARFFSADCCCLLIPSRRNRGMGTPIQVAAAVCGGNRRATVPSLNMFMPLGGEDNSTINAGQSKHRTAVPLELQRCLGSELPTPLSPSSQPGEPHVNHAKGVDEGHILGWSHPATYSLTRLAGRKHPLAPNEGAVCPRSRPGASCTSLSRVRGCVDYLRQESWEVQLHKRAANSRRRRRRCASDLRPPCERVLFKRRASPRRAYHSTGGGRAHDR